MADLWNPTGHRRRRGPVDPSLTAQFILSAHHPLGTSRRANSSPKAGDRDRITPGLGLRCHDRLSGLIHEYAQVASYG